MSKKLSHDSCQSLELWDISKSPRTPQTPRKAGISFADSVQVIGADDSVMELPMMDHSARRLDLSAPGMDHSPTALSSGDQHSFRSQSSESESAHSLTLDDILSPDSSSNSDGDDATDLKKKEEENEDEGNGMAKAAAQTGVLLMMAPLFSFFQGLFRRNRDDDLPINDSLSKKAPEMHPQNQALTRAGQIPEMGQTMSRSARLGAQTSMESSRSLAGTFAYVPGDPVSQQVMRQAMLTAARSATTTVGQTSVALAGTASTTAGVAAGTKILIAGLIVSLLGAGMAGVVIKAGKDMNEDEDRGGGIGGGKGGGGSGGVNGNSTAIPEECINGITTISKLPCTLLEPECEDWQTEVDGECVVCPDGHVTVHSNHDFSTLVCEVCPPGQVRSSADGKANGPCVPAELFCESWQQATDGTCSTCGAGQVSIVDEDQGFPTFQSCDYCSPGLVRSSADGTQPGNCVSAAQHCDSWQHAENGRCNDCGNGQVGAVGLDGEPTFEGCIYCDAGQVRQSADGNTVGPCVSAVGICSRYQEAKQGRCNDCGAGFATSIDTSGNPTHLKCESCPPGEVRSSADGEALGPCVSAEGFCDDFQIAAYGKCNSCPRGQVSALDSAGNPTYISCQICPRGQVRMDADGREEGPCISASGICTENQRAFKGQCINCIDGEVSSSNPDGSFNHLSCIVA